MRTISILSLFALLVVCACDSQPKSQKSAVASPQISDDVLRKINEARDQVIAPIQDLDHRVVQATDLVFSAIRNNCDAIENLQMVQNNFTHLLSSRDIAMDDMRRFNDNVTSILAGSGDQKVLLQELEQFKNQAGEPPYKQALIALYESMRVAGIDDPMIDEVLDQQHSELPEGAVQEPKPENVEAPVEVISPAE